MATNESKAVLRDQDNSLRQLRATLAASEAQLAAAEKETATAAGRVAGLEARLAVVDREHWRANTVLGQLQTTVAALRRRQCQAAVDGADLETALGVQRDVYAHLQSRLAALVAQDKLNRTVFSSVLRREPLGDPEPSPLVKSREDILRATLQHQVSVDAQHRAVKAHLRDTVHAVAAAEREMHATGVALHDLSVAEAKTMYRTDALRDDDTRRRSLLDKLNTEMQTKAAELQALEDAVQDLTRRLNISTTPKPPPGLPAFQYD